MSPDLTLRSLRVFMALAETASVSTAAARIGGSPSGVSQHVTTLEAALGAKLFDRRARPIALTPAGRVLKAHAAGILEAVSKAHAEMTALNLAVLPELSLAVIDDLDASLTPALVGQLRRRYPGCFVTTFSSQSDLVRDRLVSREADVALTAVVPDAPETFRSIPLLEEDFVLVAAKGRFDPDGDVQAQIGAMPFVRYADALPMGRRVSEHLDRSRLTASHDVAFEASRSVLGMVVEAEGWTLTTPLNLLDAERFMERLDVHASPIPRFSRTIYLCARHDELGGLTAWLADRSHALLATQILPRFAEIAPHLGGAMRMLHEPDGSADAEPERSADVEPDREA